MDDTLVWQPAEGILFDALKALRLARSGKLQRPMPLERTNKKNNNRAVTLPMIHLAAHLRAEWSWCNLLMHGHAHTKSFGSGQASGYGQHSGLSNYGHTLKKIYPV